MTLDTQEGGTVPRASHRSQMRAQVRATRQSEGGGGAAADPEPSARAPAARPGGTHCAGQGPGSSVRSSRLRPPPVPPAPSAPSPAALTPRSRPAGRSRPQGGRRRPCAGPQSSRQGRSRAGRVPGHRTQDTGRAAGSEGYAAGSSQWPAALPEKQKGVHGVPQDRDLLWLPGGRCQPPPGAREVPVSPPASLCPSSRQETRKQHGEEGAGRPPRLTPTPAPRLLGMTAAAQRPPPAPAPSEAGGSVPDPRR